MPHNFFALTDLKLHATSQMIAIGHYPESFQSNSLAFFFFIYWRYNPLWVLAFSAILLNSVLF